MNILVRAYSSSLGKKYIMAISGFALFLFVIAHMAGNLQIFLGREAINAYAEFLKSKPGLLWSARAGLLILVILHITAAIQLVSENNDARPVKYEEGRPTAASLASRTIFVSGLVIFAFVIYHLLHFTFGVTNPEFLTAKDPGDPLRHDVYGMMINGFSNPWVSAFYIISMGLLCLHLSHGVSSAFQSLGIRNKGNVRAIHRTARIAALVIFVGNCAIVLAVLLRWVR
ncbi:MAG TPA: succinate dehydrogenase cytochrome b subunit [Blastocatellia bacterium]|jgi:succinate dehydrogenase / fumarate reductase cytochrome b subunit|nr:succinate dehydrogenase cytochrome b subunit [Blastocatellia bacterium]